MTYSEKLKDPRWQQTRLKVMERDGFACRECRSKTDTLHVHHSYYVSKRDPWQYPLKTLVTLCKDCHEAANIRATEPDQDDGTPSFDEWEFQAGNSISHPNTDPWQAIGFLSYRSDRTPHDLTNLIDECASAGIISKETVDAWAESLKAHRASRGKATE